MKVLKATQEQYEMLNGYQFGVSRLEFVKDADDNWIVPDAVKNDRNFEGIYPQLMALEEIDFNPIIEIEENPIEEIDQNPIIEDIE